MELEVDVWFANYLRDRKRVAYGVPHGRITGPLFFILCLPAVTTNSSVALFPDDGKCYRAIESPTDRNLPKLDLTPCAAGRYLGNLNKMHLKRSY
jgi:hypothetical protein